MRIAQKLPVVIVSLVLSSAVLSGLVAYSKSSSQLVEASKASLSGLVEARRGHLAAQLEAFGQDVEILASDATVVSAVTHMDEAIAAMRRGSINPVDYIKKNFIEKNPQPPEKRYLYTGSLDSSEWGIAHGDYHTTFRKIMERRRLSDIMLVNSVGRVVYTTAKHVDLMEDLTSAAFKETAPGLLFQKFFKQHKGGSVEFADFTIYAPAGTPVAFVASPILDSGEDFVGVLMLEMPVARVNELLGEASGLGNSGEAILVGGDGKRRNDSRFSGKGAALIDGVDNQAVKLGLAGETGVISTVDATGRSLLTAEAPLVYGGAKWALIVQADVAEILAPVAAMRVSLILGGVLILVVAGAAGLFFAARISKPKIGRAHV